MLRSRQGRLMVLAPLVGGAAGAALAITALLVTSATGGPQLPAANARVLLPGTFGALVTIGAFAFWMRPVAAQLAATSLPPRSVVMVMRDRFQSRVVAVTVAALTYQAISVLQLPAVDQDTPAIPVVVGVTLAVLAIVGLLVAMHQAVESTRPGRVLAELVEGIVRHLEADGHPPGSAADLETPTGAGDIVVSEASGWVTAIDETGLVEDLPPGTTARVEIGEGSFVIEGSTPLVTVWASPPLEHAEHDRLARHVRVGEQADEELDLPSAVSHLVDIGVHAMHGAGAPSIVYEVVWQVGLVLHVAMRNEIGRGSREQPDGVQLLWRRSLDHGELVVTSVERLRQATASDTAAALALVTVLRDVRAEADRHGRTDAVRALDHQMELCAAQARQAGGLPHDVAAIERVRTDPEPGSESAVRGWDGDAETGTDRSATARRDRDRTPAGAQRR